MLDNNLTRHKILHLEYYVALSVQLSVLNPFTEFNHNSYINLSSTSDDQ